MGNEPLKKPPSGNGSSSSMPGASKIATDDAEEGLLNDAKLEDYKNNPLGLFQQWFQQAFQKGVQEPFIMFLATSSSEGVPSVRPVALGNVDEKGFYFATNVKSNKVKDLDQNPKVAVSFYWSKLGLSIRITGPVEVTHDDGATYHRWPRSSQIEEHCSVDVGTPLENRKDFIKEIESLTTKFAGLEVIPQPESVRTYRIIPKSYEFLQVHTAQLTDRIQFKKETTGGSWECVRLAR